MTADDEVVRVDARGLRCPLPVIRLAAVAKTLAAGTVIEVLWTDPAARHDIPAWARMRGHEVVGTIIEDDVRGVTMVRLGPAPVAGRHGCVGRRRRGAPY
ncbi:sulfurtransferase TusA family protein [Actinotalea solisilvae]|uniref:sulfurtransferase TusA family protein n=1 Tax=Actinotalea solisilvae TaxID=2072922 RepID=UPI0027DCCA9B|nr:sulfurtransferase TusA family protein [Actinotalea solisilvae]